MRIWPFSKTEEKSKLDRYSDQQKADVCHEIERILFPPVNKHLTSDGTEYFVDRSIDTNLYAALIDLQEGFCDDIVIKSIEDAIDALTKVKKILDVKQEVLSDADMLVVAPPEAVDSIRKML